MADFLTHILMADDVLERVESRRILEGIRKHRTLYRLGAQGPDPLFFITVFPETERACLTNSGMPCTGSGPVNFCWQDSAGCRNCPGAGNGWSLPHIFPALHVISPLTV